MVEAGGLRFGDSIQGIRPWASAQNVAAVYFSSPSVPSYWLSVPTRLRPAAFANRTGPTAHRDPGSVSPAPDTRIAWLHGQFPPKGDGIPAITSAAAHPGMETVAADTREPGAGTTCRGIPEFGSVGGTVVATREAKAATSPTERTIHSSALRTASHGLAWLQLHRIRS